MIINTFGSLSEGVVATAVGITGLLGLLFIILFFTVGKPFGTLNDICIGLTAVLSAILACSFSQRGLVEPTALSKALVYIALMGSLVVVTGSVLVISRITGWFLAGLYMAAGNALIGLWLIGLAWSALSTDSWPQGLAILGLITGVILAFGLAAVPGMVKGTDPDQYSSSILNILWGSSALGWLALFPIWCLLTGRWLLAM